MNYAKLKASMIIHGDTQTSLGEKLGISKSLMSLRMTGKIPFSLDEAKRITQMYELESDDAYEIFLS